MLDASFRKNITGVGHTIFISSRGGARQAPYIKVAINPFDSLDPQCAVASVSFDGEVVAGAIDPLLLRQVRHFIGLNRQALLDYWNYAIDTAQLQDRLRQ